VGERWDLDWLPQPVAVAEREEQQQPFAVQSLCGHAAVQPSRRPHAHAQTKAEVSIQTVQVP
jgi:hypothetical protein